MTPGKGLTNQQKRSALLEACKAKTAQQAVVHKKEVSVPREFIEVAPEKKVVELIQTQPVKPAQSTIAANPPSTPTRPETFGERALRLHYAARLVLPDVAPTVELATTSTDPLVLEACARSTDFEVLMAVLNNPSTPFTAIEVVTSNERVAAYIVKQSEGRERAAK